MLLAAPTSMPRSTGASPLMLDMRQPGVEVAAGADERCERVLRGLPHRVACRSATWSARSAGAEVARTTAHVRATRRGHPWRRGGSGTSPATSTVRSASWSRSGGRPAAPPTPRPCSVPIEPRPAPRPADDSALRDRVVRYWVHSEVHRHNGCRLRDWRGRECRPLTALLKLDSRCWRTSRGPVVRAVRARRRSRGVRPDGGRVVRTGLSSFVPSLGGGTRDPAEHRRRRTSDFREPRSTPSALPRVRVVMGWEGWPGRRRVAERAGARRSHR